MTTKLNDPANKDSTKINKSRTFMQKQK